MWVFVLFALQAQINAHICDKYIMNSCNCKEKIGNAPRAPAEFCQSVVLLGKFARLAQSKSKIGFSLLPVYE